MFKAIWFLSVMLVLANLLFVYANLPEQIIVMDDPGNQLLSKEWLFYSVMIAILLINVMVYLFKRMFPEAEHLRAWFHGFVITINIFIIIAMQALNVYNGFEKYDHNRMEFFISGSLGLVIVWSLIWPLYLVYQKFFFKQAV
jgi:hypothetical protein